MNLHFHEAAEQEYLEAVGYLDSQAQGLGSNFIEEIERATSFMCSFPESSPLVGKNIRKKTLRKFAYNLLYVVEENDIIILAVMHQSRRPNYWISRL